MTIIVRSDKLQGMSLLMDYGEMVIKFDIEPVKMGHAFFALRVTMLQP